MADDNHADDNVLIGTSRMRNSASGEELWNTWRRQITETSLDLEIGSTLDPTVMQTIHTVSPDVIRHNRQVENIMRQVERRAKRNRGDYAVPKPTTRSNNLGMTVCPDCEGSGELVIDDKNQTCPRCHGKKFITRPR